MSHADFLGAVYLLALLLGAVAILICHIGGENEEEGGDD